MDWRSIPSLLALRAFEAAARTGSYTRAATELNVTHAAIAQHVRKLEDHFGQSLLDRAGRGMAPTEAGAQLARALTEGFGTIAQGVADLARSDGTRPLAITTTYTLTETWLMPRLPGFWASHPGIQLAITPSTEAVDLRRAGFDFGIRFGKGHWPGLTAELLLAAQNIVVAAPHLVGDRRPGHLADFADLTWISDALYPESQRWLAAQGIDPDSLKWQLLPMGSFILPALRAGGGVAVMPRAIVLDDVREGRLQVIHDTPDTTGEPAYYLVSHDGPRHPGAAIFRRWLKEQAAV